MAKLTLQEQMLKAGLVNEKNLKRRKKAPKISNASSEVKEAVEENNEHSKKKIKFCVLSRKKRLNKEIQAQVKQLIDMNWIAQSDGDIKYNFTDGTMVKSIYVEPLIQSQLAKGILSIARYEETYVIIPTSVAKIMLRDNDTIIEQNSK